MGLIMKKIIALCVFIACPLQGMQRFRSAWIGMRAALHTLQQRKGSLKKITPYLVPTVVTTGLAIATLEASTRFSLKRSDLCKEMKEYKTTNTRWHDGDLYEHSVWVARCLEDWRDTKSPWLKDIPSRYHDLLVLAGFMHDVGKAGDHKFNYFDKPQHPRDGFEYLLGKKKFIKKDQTTFDFDMFFKEHGLTKEEQQIIAILTGIHWHFGKCLRDIYKEKVPHEIAFSSFLHDLQSLVQEAGYNNGNLDKKIIAMSIAIGAADIKGSKEIKGCCVALEIDECTSPHVVQASNNYKRFKVGKNGLRTRDALLTYAKENCL